MNNEEKIEEVTAKLIGHDLRLRKPIRVKAGECVTFTVPVLYGPISSIKGTLAADRDGVCIGCVVRAMEIVELVWE